MTHWPNIMVQPYIVSGSVYIDPGGRKGGREGGREGERGISF